MCTINVENIVLPAIKEIDGVNVAQPTKLTSANVKFVQEVVCWGDHSHKYLEKITWDRGKKLCVAVGYNPTNNEVGDIDGTNIKIIKALKSKGYGGYYLLNLYPQRSDDKTDFDESDTIGIEYHALLPKILHEIFEYTQYDFLVFWGRTAVIEEPIFEEINKFARRRRLMATVKKAQNIIIILQERKLILSILQKNSRRMDINLLAKLIKTVRNRFSANGVSNKI